jgi:hypothetical protein
VLLKRPKALVTFRHQGDAALKFWRVKEAGPVARPGCCPAKMQGQGRAGPGCWFRRSSGGGWCAGLGRLDLESPGLDQGRGLVRDGGLGRGSGLGCCWSLLNRGSLGRGLFRRGRCSSASRGRFRNSPDFRHRRALSFVIYAGALGACAGIHSCPGAAGGCAGVGGILLGSCVHVDIRSRRFLLSPRVHVDVGGRVILFRRRIVLRRGGSLVQRRRRCRRRGSSVAC